MGGGTPAGFFTSKEWRNGIIGPYTMALARQPGPKVCESVKVLDDLVVDVR